MLIKIRAIYTDKLVKTSTFLFIATQVTSVSNYVFQVIMGRLLSPKDYGLMNALLSLFTVMAVPVGTLLMVVTKKTAEYKSKNDLVNIKNLFTVVNSRMLIIGSLGLILFFLSSSYIRDYLHAPNTMPIFILGISIFIALAYPINIAVLQGMQEYKWLSFNQGLVGPAKLIFCVLFVLIGFNVNGVMAGLVMSSLILWLTSFLPIRKYLPQDALTPVVKSHISFVHVIPVFLANLAFAVLTQADVILASRYFIAHQSGIYAAAAIPGKAVMYIPGAIILALFPMVSEQTALNQSSRHLLLKSLFITLLISGSSAALFFLFPDRIISIIYGARYQESGNILKYYGIAMLPMALLMILMNYLIAQGKRLFPYIMAGGAVVEVIVIQFWHNSPLLLVAMMAFLSSFLFISGILLQIINAELPNCTSRG